MPVVQKQTISNLKACLLSEPLDQDHFVIGPKVKFTKTLVIQNTGDTEWAAGSVSLVLTNNQELTDFQQKIIKCRVRQG